MMRRRIALLALASLVACDLPTEAPRWETTWQVSGETVEVSVAELLPSGVDLNADSSAFVVETPGASVTVSLAGLCSLCGPGLDLPFAVPKPEFEDTLTTSTSLPADLVSASLTGGSFDVVLEHSFQFDPLNPTPGDPSAPTGHVVISLSSGGTTIARDSIDGADASFGPGDTLVPDLPIQPVTVANDLALAVRIYSPSGDPVQLSSSDTLGVTLNPSLIEVSEVTVAATSVQLDPTPTEFDFSGLDTVTVERVRGGALIFDVENPFTVEGTLDLAFQLPAQPDVTTSFELREGSFQEVVDFTGAELRSILGSDNAQLVAAGTVSAPSGTVTVTPGQVLTVDTSFRLIVLVGGTEED